MNVFTATFFVRVKNGNRSNILLLTNVNKMWLIKKRMLWTDHSYCPTAISLETLSKNSLATPTHTPDSRTKVMIITALSYTLGRIQLDEHFYGCSTSKWSQLQGQWKRKEKGLSLMRLLSGTRERLSLTAALHLCFLTSGSLSLLPCPFLSCSVSALK